MRKSNKRIKRSTYLVSQLLAELTKISLVHLVLYGATKGAMERLNFQKPLLRIYIYYFREGLKRSAKKSWAGGKKKELNSYGPQRKRLMDLREKNDITPYKITPYKKHLSSNKRSWWKISDFIWLKKKNFLTTCQVKRGEELICMIFIKKMFLGNRSLKK